jgi:hypothetical protein
MIVAHGADWDKGTGRVGLSEGLCFPNIFIYTLAPHPGLLCAGTGCGRANGVSGCWVCWACLSLPTKPSTSPKGRGWFQTGSACIGPGQALCPSVEQKGVRSVTADTSLGAGCTTHGLQWSICTHETMPSNAQKRRSCLSTVFW